MKLQVKHLKSNEIRVGNNVLFNKEIIKLDGALFAMYLENRLGLPFYPIPLTEDMLLRLGIIKKNLTEDMPEDLQKPDIDEDGNIWYTWVKGAFNLEIQTSGEVWFEVYSHYIHVKYVHQLQNLYFALTDEELEFKQ